MKNRRDDGGESATRAINGAEAAWVRAEEAAAADTKTFESSRGRLSCAEEATAVFPGGWSSALENGKKFANFFGLHNPPTRPYHASNTRFTPVTRLLRSLIVV